jgi:hypothetical protein
LDESPVLLPWRLSVSRDTNRFHLFFVKELAANGLFTPEAIFVKETASLREVEGGIDEPLPRVISHELGHALGLVHRQNRTNLMASGTTGTSLNPAEVSTARRRAHALPWRISAATLLQKADALKAAGDLEEAGQLYRRLADSPGPSRHATPGSSPSESSSQR